MPALEAVRATTLTRSFGSRVAVRNLSISLHRGEIVALLGPNGAGKTTTLRMLAGLIPPSSGTVELEGVVLHPKSSDSLRRRVGLLTESPGLWDRLTVQMNLVTYARLYGLANPQEAVDRALAMVTLLDRRRDVAGSLSKGLRQRLALARALMHDPAIILLDEPTSGLDPANARHVRDLIAGFRRDGRALLVSTHNLHEAEELADRIAVLNTDLLADASPSVLRQRITGMHVDIEVEGPAAEWQTFLPPTVVESTRVAGSLLSLTLAGGHEVPDIVASLVKAGARVRRVVPRERTLEEVYLSLVGDIEGAA
jgi:ABC-2 type transport system ATP-binding protein